MTDKAPVPESDESTSTRSTRKEDLARAKAIRKAQTAGSFQAQSIRGPDDHAGPREVDASASIAGPQKTRAPASSKPTPWLLGSIGVIAALLAIVIISNHGASTNQGSTAIRGSALVSSPEKMPSKTSAASEVDGARQIRAVVDTGAAANTLTTFPYHAVAFEEAMSLERTSEDFYAAVDASVEKLIADRVIPATPLIRADYTSYYQVVSLYRFLGSSVVILEHEYFEEYIGCCVNGGLSLILRGPATPEVQEFAKKRNCALKSESDIYLPQEVKASLGSEESSATDLTEISCKESDAYQ